MSIREKICDHKPSRQIKTAHGQFCLDCGYLEARLLKNNLITHRNTKSQAGSKNFGKTTSDLISTHHVSRTDTAPSTHVKIRLADIRPKKRPQN